jgi:hypothetical protein
MMGAMVTYGVLSPARTVMVTAASPLLSRLLPTTENTYTLRLSVPLGIVTKPPLAYEVCR